MWRFSKTSLAKERKKKTGYTENEEKETRNGGTRGGQVFFAIK